MRKVTARTVLNRRALSAVREGEVAGMEEVGQRFREVIRPPDAAPYGKGLIQTPDYGVWIGGKKVAGTATKPRSVKVRQRGAVLIAGEGFPGRFQELGTVHNPPQPHVTPAMLEVLPGAGGYIKPAVRNRLARLP